MNSEISHEGIVESAEKNSVMVLLSPGVSCSGCQASGSCNISGDDRKIIKVDGSYDFSQGEKVLVSMKRSQGYSALVLGYLIPLVLVVVSLIVLLLLSLNELYAGLISICLLIPYYLTLLLLRKSISRRFTFSLTAVNK